MKRKFFLYFCNGGKWWNFEGGLKEILIEDKKKEETEDERELGGLEMTGRKVKKREREIEKKRKD